MRCRYVGDLGDGYRLQVRVLGIWWTIAAADRYACAQMGSILAALLDSLYIRITKSVTGALSYRVAIVKRGSEADEAARRHDSRVVADHAVRVLRKAGVLNGAQP